MKLVDAPEKIVLPFADGGGKNAIPVPSQIGITAGAASYTDGFPPLTRTLKSAGGVPPSGLDMNGVLFYLSAITRWANAGAGFEYDSTFANDANVSGYPVGARVLRSDGNGYWLNTVDDNTTDPESSGAAAAGWVPDFTNGISAITMASANVTLSELEYGKPIIVISGTITTNLNLIFPNIKSQWTVINNTTGAFSITCKTSAGTGVVVNGAQPIVGDGVNISGVTGSALHSYFDDSLVKFTALTVQEAIEFAASSGGFSWVIKSASYTASDGDGILVDTSVATVPITLPASPVLGDKVAISDYSKTFGTYPCTIGRNGENINGAAYDITLFLDGQGGVFVYSGATRGWIFTDTTNAVSNFELSNITLATSATGTDYNSEPQLAYCDDYNVICAYRKGSAHANNDGTIVGKKSSDLGKTWGSEFTIHDHVSGYDTRNPTIGKDPSTGRLIVFSRTYDAVGATHQAIFYQTSDDDGVTWSAATDISSLFSDITADFFIPFGAIIETTNGLMQIVYAIRASTNQQFAFALFSTDGGQTWGSRSTIYSVTQSLATFSEPFPVAIDNDRILVIIRENQNGEDYWYTKSSDGGLTWDSTSGKQITWSATAIPVAAPVSMCKIGNEVELAWGARTPDYAMYTVRLSAESFFMYPPWAFTSEPRRRIWRSVISGGGAATDAEYGYPYVLTIPDIPHTTLIAWYDSKDDTDVTDTNIYITSTPRY